MQLHEIRKALHGEAYDFLRTNPHLGSRVMLLGLGGSHAYGTDTETSDLDIRGCAVLSKAEILCGESFEQVTDVATDTTIYAFPKLIHLLKDCNPNTIEILGLKPEHYLYLSEAGRPAGQPEAVSVPAGSQLVQRLCYGTVSPHGQQVRPNRRTACTGNAHSEQYPKCEKAFSGTVFSVSGRCHSSLHRRCSQPADAEGNFHGYFPEALPVAGL